MGLKVGDKIYYMEHSRIIEREVTSVGRIWVTTDYFDKVKVKTLRTVNKSYPQFEIQFYLSKQAIQDEITENAFIRKVRDEFQYKSITIEQAKEIAKILGI